MKRIVAVSIFLVLVFTSGWIFSAAIVPSNIDQPGTQPSEIPDLKSPNSCNGCHGGYNSSVEPVFNWRGSMMANASRDPIFWGTVAIAEQDFDGAGDLCIRCHSTSGWLSGRSTPTDGSGLSSEDSDGVDCDFCHKLTNPDNSEHLGVMFPPFVANDGVDGYYGSGITSMWGGRDVLGPFADPQTLHPYWMQSKFHRSVDYCGTCHDISNPAVGNLAHNFGAQSTADPVIADGDPDPESPVDTKAAFNNFPYKYGVVERTFSEYKSGLISQTLVDDYINLPADLKGGALEAIYEDSTNGGIKSANYEDGDLRYYTCQSCHMRPVVGIGSDYLTPIRADLPLHDMTGGSYWMPTVIKYLDAQGKLRLGGGLTDTQKSALDAGARRAKEQLKLAVSLSVAENNLKIVNHTGHKLISGFPEGRRMWLNIKWYDASGNLLREDGAYGPIGATIPNPVGGPDVEVKSILDLDDPNTKIYEAHYAMTQEWANQLLALGKPAGLVLSYDRYTGAPDFTLGMLAGASPGTYHETFHFVLNNKVAKDNRIPPYGMSYEEARRRNTLPVPADQYGCSPAPCSVYNYYDEINLNPPENSEYAYINMLYQSTSWEYIQFLHLANNLPNGAFLANEGLYMLEGWLNNGMAAPYTMASSVWGTPPAPQQPPPPERQQGTSPRFNWYRGAGCFEMSFDASSNDSTIFEWDFGDGTSGSGEVTSHTFPSKRTYLVTLTVDGDRQRTMAVPVKAIHKRPSVSMNVSVDNTDLTGMTILVEDASTDNSCEGSGTGTAMVLWGDGTTTLKAISTGDVIGNHKFNQSGIYTISYSFRDSEGNRAMSHHATVTVPDVATSTCNITGTLCIDGAADGCNDVGYCSDSQWGTQDYCEADGDTWTDGADTAIRNAMVKLMNGHSIVKVGKSNQAGVYTITNAQAGFAYDVVPVKTGFTFTPTSSALILNCSANSPVNFTATP